MMFSIIVGLMTVDLAYATSLINCGATMSVESLLALGLYDMLFLYSSSSHNFTKPSLALSGNWLRRWMQPIAMMESPIEDSLAASNVFTFLIHKFLVLVNCVDSYINELP